MMRVSSLQYRSYKVLKRSSRLLCDSKYIWKALLKTHDSVRLVRMANHR